MTRAKTKLLAMPIVIFMAIAATAAAQPAVITSYSFTIPLDETPWGVTGFPFNQPAVTATLPEYDASMYGGSILEEVCIHLSGSADSDITLTAIGDVAVQSGQVGADIIAANFSNSAGTLSLNAFPSGAIAPPQINLLNGSSTSVSVSGTDMDSLLLSGAAASAFAGTGNFTVDVSANGSNTLMLLGGNVDVMQRTDASAVLTIEYKGTVVPEPASGTMALFAVLGMLKLRRRR